jgi:hypothetical protein
MFMGSPETVKRPRFSSPSKGCPGSGEITIGKKSDRKNTQYCYEAMKCPITEELYEFSHLEVSF